MNDPIGGKDVPLQNGSSIDKPGLLGKQEGGWWRSVAICLFSPHGQPLHGRKLLSFSQVLQSGCQAYCYQYAAQDFARV